MTIKRTIKRTFAVTLITSLLFCATPIQAADPALDSTKQAVKLNDVAEAALARWEAKEYRPVEAGLTEGSFTMKVNITGHGETQGSASYRWSAKGQSRTSELSWDPEYLGQMLSREGWSKQKFDSDYLTLDQRGRFHGCELVGKKNEDGSVSIHIQGKSASGLRELHFDRDGILNKEVYEVAMGGGEPMRFSLNPTFQEEHGNRVKTVEVFHMKMPFGEVVSTSKLEYQKIKDSLVLRRIHETSTWNGDPSGTRDFEFVDWKLTTE